MKGKWFVSLLLLAAPIASFAGDQMIPGGSLIQCTVAEPKISSKVDAVGDPVLCQVSHVELYGRSVFPYGSYLEGRFEDYKDPGHFVGKGWMELKFDRLVIGDMVIPAAARVVYVPKYPVDKEGRIHGTGHPVRDAVEWAIPVLWPLDLINLPRRGPRPVLKAETRLTIKVMDDLLIPSRDEFAQQQPGLQPRVPEQPMQYQAPYQQPQYQAPARQSYAPPPQQPTYQYTQAPAVVYAPPPQQVVYVAPPAPVFVSAPIIYGYMAASAPVAVPYGYTYGPYGPTGVAMFRPQLYAGY